MGEFPWAVIWVVMQQNPRLGTWLPVSFHRDLEEADAAQTTESQRVEAWVALPKHSDEVHELEKAMRLMRALREASL